MSESAQLIAGGLIFAGFVVVALLGRRRRVGGGQHELAVGELLDVDGTGALFGQGDGTAVFVCDLCSAISPSSRSQSLLRDWAHQHIAQYHPSHPIR